MNMADKCYAYWETHDGCKGLICRGAADCPYINDSKGTPREATYTTKPVTIKEFDRYKNRYARGSVFTGWDFNSFIHVNPATVKEE